ncbi:hypothetical protein PIB30_086286 [Stylosanthes scabra]|uniref:Uncharacterized protein n=1 Tax=Stylosanthes scabra TaxID=79078 RepID=A0ABU6QTS9_9FABA|nr:hypothetical protein [Stylosanthes scabra]
MNVGATPPRVSKLSADLTSLLRALKHVHLISDTSGYQSSFLILSLHMGFGRRLDPIHSGHRVSSGIGLNDSPQLPRASAATTLPQQPTVPEPPGPSELIAAKVAHRWL